MCVRVVEMLSFEVNNLRGEVRPARRYGPRRSTHGDSGSISSSQGEGRARKQMAASLKTHLRSSEMITPSNSLNRETMCPLVRACVCVCAFVFAFFLGGVGGVRGEIVPGFINRY